MFLAGVTSSLAETPTLPAGTRTIDIEPGSGVASIATRADGKGYAAVFAHCRMAFFDRAAMVQSQRNVDGCKLMFTVHIGQVKGAEAASASIYTGEAVVVADGALSRYKTHDAAVTEAFLAFGGLLTASDEGNVVLSSLDGKQPARVLATGQGVARVLLPDPGADATSPSFFIAFDSGHVLSVHGSDRRTYDPGVGRINGLALSLDRRSLFVGGFDGRVRRVDLVSGAVSDLFVAGADVNAIALDDKSGRLAIVSDTGHLVVVDTARGTTVVDMTVASVPLSAVALEEGGAKALVGDASGVLHLVPLPTAATAAPVSK